MKGMPERPFTPETLAERWSCSAKNVREMCRDGRLKSFRVGKMYRIAAATVADFERGDQAADPKARGE